MRICITGSPMAGKTRLAEFLSKIVNAPILHTDDVAYMDWSDASSEVARWLDRPGPWIIEGVTIPRALRKWRNSSPLREPGIDWFILMREPRRMLTEQGQETMQKQVIGLSETMREWIGERWLEI